MKKWKLQSSASNTLKIEHPATHTGKEKQIDGGINWRFTKHEKHDYLHTAKPYSWHRSNKSSQYQKFTSSEMNTDNSQTPSSMKTRNLWSPASNALKIKHPPTTGNEKKNRRRYKLVIDQARSAWLLTFCEVMFMAQKQQSSQYQKSTSSEMNTHNSPPPNSMKKLKLQSSALNALAIEHPHTTTQEMKNKSTEI